MPGGYGTEDTPWGTGGTTSGDFPTTGSNLVAEAANSPTGVNSQGQNLQEALAASGQSSAPSSGVFASSVGAPVSGPHGDQGSAMETLQESIAAVTPQQAQESYQETQNIVNQLAAGLTPDQIQAGETVPTKAEGIVTPDKVETYTDFVNNQLVTKNLPLLMKKTGATSYRIDSDGRIVLIDDITGKHWIMNLAGGLDEIGAGITGFDPFEVEDMGDVGKAQIYSKLSGMSEAEFRDFLNRKGNLDRILQYAGIGDVTDPRKIFLDEEGEYYLDEKGDIASTGTGIVNLDAIEDLTAQELANMIKGQGGAGFDEALMKIENPQQYWNENPPRTQGDVEEAAAAGISWIEGYGPVERPEGAGGGGGGAGITNLEPLQQLAATVPAATTTTVPAATTTTIPAATTTAATMTTPTPFDYSQWPQFTSAYPGSNYVNQGLGQGPNFDYWNQIARTFPGMRNYG